MENIREMLIRDYNFEDKSDLNLYDNDLDTYVRIIKYIHNTKNRGTLQVADGINLGEIVEDYIKVLEEKNILKTESESEKEYRGISNNKKGVIDVTDKFIDGNFEQRLSKCKCLNCDKDALNELGVTFLWIIYKGELTEEFLSKALI